MKTLPFWILLLMTFGLACTDKIFGGGVPDWFIKQFEHTFLNLFPGALTLSFFGIALLEFSTCVLIVTGLLRREFLKKSDQKFLTAGSLLAQITFIALGFGERLTHKYDVAAQLFAYTALTFLVAHFALAKRDGKNA